MDAGFLLTRPVPSPRFFNKERVRVRGGRLRSAISLPLIPTFSPQAGRRGKNEISYLHPSWGGRRATAATAFPIRDVATNIACEHGQSRDHPP